MHFAVDAHAIGRHLTGNEVYVRNLLASFAAMDSAATFTAYYSVEGAQALIPPRFRRRHVSDNPFLRLGFDLSRHLRQDKPDLLHVQYSAPLACPVPVVASVHDISFLEHPEFFPRARALQLRFTVERTVRQAARVVAPSEFSRQSILRAYNLPPGRVSVAPIAVSEAFHPLPAERARQRVRERFGFREPYVLTVGDLQPRKNHAGLIQAFRALVERQPRLPHKLVLAGKPTWYARKIYDAADRSGLNGRVHFTGFVGDEDLLDLYNGCDLFVFPSLYEGFGMPILEAMACGRAVACADTSAMPEVADAAALLFHPEDHEAMAGAMGDLLGDRELRAHMERLGARRAGLFTWANTAAQTLDVYYSVAGAPRSVPVSAQAARS